MPLLITPAAPLTAGNGLPVTSAYAIIEDTSYSTREKVIRFTIGYFANEQAYLDTLNELNVAQQFFPRAIAQPATPAEADAGPIFQFMESLLVAHLTAALGEGARIENVA